MRGIAAMTAASGIFVIGDTLVKLAAQSMPLSETIVLRSVVAGAVLTAFIVKSGAGQHLRRAFSNPFVRLRSLFEAATTITFFTGLLGMSYADGVAVMQVTPLAVTAGAAVFLGEPVGWRRWLAAFAGLVGVLIILRPGTGAFNVSAVWILACVVFMAARDLATRRIGTFIPTSVVTLAAITAIGVASLLLAPLGAAWVVPSFGLGLAIVTAALASTMGFVAVVISMRSGEVSVVAPFRYATIPFAVLSSIVVFGDWPDGPTLFGLAIVICAGLYSLHRERLRSRDAARARRAAMAVLEA
jgi:drug/metabolite transporter (DMT)-like permease